MKRTLLAAFVGFVAWWVAATVLDRALRLVWPAYAALLPTLSFTLGMLAARLIEGALSTLTAGAVAGWIAGRQRAAGLATGGLLLLFFVPTHAMLWSRFPIWYHLLFLGSLAPLAWFGTMRFGKRAPPGSPSSRA